MPKTSKLPEKAVLHRLQPKKCVKGVYLPTFLKKGGHYPLENIFINMILYFN